MIMKPLVIVTVMNRPKETMRTLETLAETTNDLRDIELVIVDNGSSGGLPMTMINWANEVCRGCSDAKVVVESLPKNIGCPKALNRALKRHRAPGQPMVKLDNDVEILTNGWVCEIQNLIAERDQPIAMIGAFYPGALEGRLLQTLGLFGESTLHLATPIIGHAVWHTGEFLDTVGYFDVLHPDHLYGFEDLIFSDKALVLEWETLVWEGWEIKNIQRSSALGRQGRDEHVTAMRPHYNERKAQILAGLTMETDSAGQPIVKGEV